MSIKSTDDVAPSTRHTYGPSGGIVPGRCVGYTYDGACYCPECAAEIDVTSSEGETFKMTHFPDRTWDKNGFGVGVLSGFDESDYPGDSCFVCHRRLQTNIIHYED